MNVKWNLRGLRCWLWSLFTEFEAHLHICSHVKTPWASLLPHTVSSSFGYIKQYSSCSAPTLRHSSPGYLEAATGPQWKFWFDYSRIFFLTQSLAFQRTKGLTRHTLCKETLYACTLLHSWINEHFFLYTLWCWKWSRENRMLRVAFSMFLLAVLNHTKDYIALNTRENHDLELSSKVPESNLELCSAG